MAGLGRKQWSPGDTLNAADVNGYLMDQSVMVFAGTAARASAIPTPSAGMVAYSTATQLEYYDGAAWQSVDVTPGLIPIVPTSVAVGSGTGTANATGQVTFTTASSVSLNGVFTSSYKNYVIVFNEDTASTTAAIQFRMRLSGTDNSTASSYRTQYIRATSTTVSAARDTLSYGQLDVSAGLQTFATLTVFNPAIASPTYFTNLANTQTTEYLEISALSHNQSTAYDGISFICASGTFTGTVSVYGYTI